MNPRNLEAVSRARRTPERPEGGRAAAGRELRHRESTGPTRAKISSF